MSIQSIITIYAAGFAAFQQALSNDVVKPRRESEKRD
jgi:hypothetical protein